MKAKTLDDFEDYREAVDKLENAKAKLNEARNTMSRLSLEISAAIASDEKTDKITAQAKALLDGDTKPTEAEMLEAVAGNICRCTGYASIRQALRRSIDERALNQPGEVGA